MPLLKILNRLIAINETEIIGSATQFLSFAGWQQIPIHYHPYTNDLDIFGRASLYQYINRTISEQGNAVIASWLTEPCSVPLLLQRQEATKELATKTNWRQQLQAYGVADAITICH